MPFVWNSSFIFSEHFKAKKWSFKDSFLTLEAAVQTKQYRLNIHLVADSDFLITSHDFHQQMEFSCLWFSSFFSWCEVPILSAEFHTVIDLTVTLKLSYHLSWAFLHLTGRSSSWLSCEGKTVFLWKTVGIGLINCLKQLVFTFSW